MKKYIFLGVFSLLLIIAFGLAFKFYKHEKWQSTEIHKLSATQTTLFNENTELKNELNALSEKLAAVEDAFYSRVEYSADAFNYLAIGNSITLHEKCDYWWNAVGMAASQPENDYFHLVSQYLNQIYKKVNSYAFNFATWEIQSADRTQTISALDKYTSAKLNLITIQLSENVTNLDTFAADMTELIGLLQKKCPSATILLIDDFWSDEKSGLKKQIAETTGIFFVSFENIRGVGEYLCGIGATVYGDDNTPHTVEHSGVAAHPGDKGMQAIADSIIAVLQSNLRQ